MAHDENEKRGLTDEETQQADKASHSGGRPSEEGEESESTESEEEM